MRSAPARAAATSSWRSAWNRDGQPLTAVVAFLARAIGDFRLVGFTKRVRGTRFAELDTRLLSPLCVCIDAASAAIAIAG